MERAGLLRLRLANWRCVEDLALELSSITILVGGNATGKSSVAYAAYFLSKVSTLRDPGRLLEDLYGVGLGGVARRGGDGRPVYPVVVEAGDRRFAARSEEEWEVSGSSPWRDSFILPSQRIGFIRLALQASRLAKKMLREWSASLLLLLAAEEVAKPVFAPPLPLFLLDYVRLLAGKRLSEEVEGAGFGRLVVRAHALLSLFELEYSDPYTGLRLPLDQAPDGSVDALLIKQVVERAPEGSLVVVEEPENHKNPLLLVDLVKEVARLAAEKNLTVVATTHSDILLQAVAKAVEEKLVEPSSVAVYHLERSAEHPWTTARRLEVYEDGTLEELPGAEKVVAALF